jgi:hypothetical protein
VALLLRLDQRALGKPQPRKLLKHELENAPNEDITVLRTKSRVYRGFSLWFAKILDTCYCFLTTALQRFSS